MDRPSPAALADGLGGEECPEDVIAGSFVHAAAGVGDFQDEPQQGDIRRVSQLLLFSQRMAKPPHSANSQPALERGLGLKEAVALNMIEIVG
ncbi:MAG: hypothetical protein WBW14_16555, partial [Candidatus Acidiferrum sp.]